MKIKDKRTRVLGGDVQITGSRSVQDTHLHDDLGDQLELFSEGTHWKHIVTSWSRQMYKALPHERLFFCTFVVIHYSMFEHCRDTEVVLLNYIIVSLKATRNI